jgi:hypothetical protein
MKTFLMSTALVLALVGSANAQWRGLAASDDGDIATYDSSSKSDAITGARNSCRNVNGAACKAIAARPWNNFAVIQCDGYVHMAADYSVAQAIRVARANAANFGHSGCRVIYSE